MTDTPPPPDHAPQPPLAEGERQKPSLELQWANMCVTGKCFLPPPTMTVRICQEVINATAALAQLTRERDAAVAREARLREALASTNSAMVNLAALISGELSSEWDERYNADYEQYITANEAARAALASTSEPEGGA